MILFTNAYFCIESVNLDDGDMTSVVSPFLFMKRTHFLDLLLIITAINAVFPL